MAINKAFINNDAFWCKMTLDELKLIDNLDCNENLKDSIRSFLTEKIQQGYLFTDDFKCSKLNYNGFEYFVAFKKEGGYERVNVWYEYNDIEDNNSLSSYDSELSEDEYF
ncbi:MAG: hypothetical protein CMF62_03090 [Magnetococcales bacterium]|nr:hypothetical protein [Magnetococcales bacterium]|tara:strand:+ start:29546 stop:29875 length:330 start_codon:yes stop_codon:yes gene_type:complete